VRRALLLGLALSVWGAWERSAAAQQGDSTPRPLPRQRFWVRPAASLLLPGAGQFLAHEERGAIYVAAEVYSLARIIQLSRKGRSEGERFRALAFTVARRSFNPTRRDTVFEYFETMERFVASGQYNQGPGPALIPENDPGTYNGSMWLLARRTFWADPDVSPDPRSPESVRALAFYQAHAVGPAFLWSWRDAEPQQATFRETIKRSDDAFRGAQNLLGVVLANHVVSVVDALISARLSAAAGRRAALQTTIGPPTVVRLCLEF